MPKVTVTIITKNEAAHIGPAIDSVRWADEIIVVDCGSTDDTVALARQHGARVEHRDWTGWVDQKTFAHSLAAHDWILSLDADDCRKCFGAGKVTPAGKQKVVECDNCKGTGKRRGRWD